MGDLTSLFDSFNDDDTKDGGLTSLFDSFYEEETPQGEPEVDLPDFEQQDPYSLEDEPDTSWEPEPVKQDKPTKYHPWGALKHSAWQGVKAIGGGLPGAIGRVVPGDDWFEKISKENKAFYDEIIGDDKDIQDYVKSVQDESESFAMEVLGNIGPTASGLGTSLIPLAGPVLATGMFYDLNTSEIEDMAIRKGADKDTAEKVGIVGGIINTALDMTGIGRMSKAFKPAKNAAVNKITNLLIGMGLTAGVEGGTEGIQGVVGEITSDWAAKPEDETTEQFADRMWEKKDKLIETFKHDASIGAATGGGIHAVGGAISPLLRPKAQPVPDKEDLVNTIKEEHPNNKKARYGAASDPALREVYSDDTIKDAKADLAYDPKLEKIEKDITTQIDRLTSPKPPDVLTAASDKLQRETADLTEAQPTEVPVPEFNFPEIMSKIPNKVMVDIDVTDQDGNITTEKVNAKKELENVNNRYETFNKILNCMAG